MCRLIAVISLLLLASTALSLSIVPVLVFQDGIETDTIFSQTLFSPYDDMEIGIGFNLKRVGLDIGYVTPYLFRGIVIHAGIYHRWEDMGNVFAPAFGIGVSIKF